MSPHPKARHFTTFDASQNLLLKPVQEIAGTMDAGWLRCHRCLARKRGSAHLPQAIQARDELRQVIGFSVADELTKLDRLKSERSISDEEYSRLRARIVA
jgi:hypothetical protein